jgi:4-aminobutyrate aminotransferase-like enzyme
MRIAPPLLIDEEQADFAIGVLDQCIAEVARRA